MLKSHILFKASSGKGNGRSPIMHPLPISFGLISARSQYSWLGYLFLFLCFTENIMLLIYFTNGNTCMSKQYLACIFLQMQIKKLYSVCLMLYSIVHVTAIVPWILNMTIFSVCCCCKLLLPTVSTHRVTERSISNTNIKYTTWSLLHFNTIKIIQSWLMSISWFYTNTTCSFKQTVLPKLVFKGVSTLWHNGSISCFIKKC